MLEKNAGVADRNLGVIGSRRELKTALPRRWALLVDDGEGFVGGAKERGGFVEDDGYGDVTEETLEFPFVLEGVEESAVFHFFQNFYSDAASDVNAAEGEHFEGEISCFVAIAGAPEIQGGGADAAGLVQAAACDFRGGVGVGIFKCGIDAFCAQ